MTNAVAGGSNTHDTRVEPEKVQQDEKAAGSRSQGSPSSLQNGSSASPMTGGRHSARAHGAGTGIVTVGVVTILISAWGALIPFVEPLFGYHVTGTPSWHWNAAHTLLAVVPGAVGIAMGFVVLWRANQVRVGRGRMGLVRGGTDHHALRSMVHRRSNGMASHQHAWRVLLIDSPTQKPALSGWICHWYRSHIGRVRRIRAGVGIPSSIQGFCGSE